MPFALLLFYRVLGILLWVLVLLMLFVRVLLSQKKAFRLKRQ